MKQRKTGTYERSSTAGEELKAFVPAALPPTRPPLRIEGELDETWARMETIDGEAAPLAKRAVEAFSSRWGTPMRSGYDISHLARQIERSADIYTSRVSNFLYATPFAYLRAKRASMPHD